ncbi:CDP-glycerol glycerophosphotransferase family protein [Streptococcus suis]
MLFKDILKRSFINLCNIFFFLLPVKQNKLLFINFNGKGYGDNPKAVCEYLRKNYPELELVWLSYSEEGFPDNVRVVKYGTIQSFYEQATAKIWLYNTRAFARMRKKKEQYFIQLWHGSAGFKFTESRANMPDSYVKQAKYDGLVTDLMVSDSRLQTEDFEQNYWFSGRIGEFGMPRNDALFDNKDNVSYKKRIREGLGISADSKIVLYAPTFRDGGSLDYLNIDFQSLITSLEKGIEQEVILLIRLHPNAAEFSKLLSFNRKMQDVTDYPDMQELLIISDLLITDYSSSITDFILLDKPFIRFAYDLEKYKTDRGLTQLYFDLPDEIIRTENELFIHSSTIWTCFEINKMNRFKSEYLKPVFDGKSSQRISVVVNEVINNI